MNPAMICTLLDEHRQALRGYDPIKMQETWDKLEPFVGFIFSSKCPECGRKGEG